MDWMTKDSKLAKGRIEKMNIKFQKLLETMDESAESREITGSKVKAFKACDYNESEFEDTTNYYANIIEKNKEMKRSIMQADNKANEKIIDYSLENLYNKKRKAPAVVPIYKIESICKENEENLLVIPYSEIPKERALTVRKSLKDILLKDIDLNKNIDIWGNVKKFCNIQIRI